MSPVPQEIFEQLCDNDYINRRDSIRKGVR